MSTKKPIAVNHVPSQIDLTDSLYDQRIIANFNYAFEYLQISREKLNNFINDLKNKYKDITIKYFDLMRDKIFYIEINKDNTNFAFLNLIININKPDTVKVHMYAKDLEAISELFNIYKKYQFRNKKDLVIQYNEYQMDPRGIISNIKYLKKEHFYDINELYYPFLDFNKFMDEFIFGNENILILCGDPGTGKSKFASLILKKLLENEKYYQHFNSKKFNYQKSNIEISGADSSSEIYEFLEEIEKELEELPDDSLNRELIYYIGASKNIEMLATDAFWSKVKNDDILIFDDLDFLLSSRKEDRQDNIKNQFISNLLSFSDGVDNNFTKIIITTNQPFDTIDEALLRKGRLFGIFEFRPLTIEEALKIWKAENLNEEDFDKFLKELNNPDSIKHCDLGEAIQNIKRNKKYISKKDYILDDSIDALKKAQKRRAGLI